MRQMHDQTRRQNRLEERYSDKIGRRIKLYFGGNSADISLKEGIAGRGTGYFPAIRCRLAHGIRNAKSVWPRCGRQAGGLKYRPRLG